MPRILASASCAQQARPDLSCRHCWYQPCHSVPEPTKAAYILLYKEARNKKKDPYAASQFLKILSYDEKATCSPEQPLEGTSSHCGFWQGCTPSKMASLRSSWEAKCSSQSCLQSVWTSECHLTAPVRAFLEMCWSCDRDVNPQYSMSIACQLCTKLFSESLYCAESPFVI